MDLVSVRKQDQILMSLVHYFVTKENYSPIYVHGVKDEIWLEKLDGPYRVIRINSNRIFNEEQFQFDQYKIKDILRQIKKKTMSFSVNALNININADEDVHDDNGLKNIDNINISKLADIEENKMVLDVFPNMKNNLIENTNGLELIFNVTNDINAKTERENKRFEKIFAPKKTYLTYGLIVICTLVYLALYIFGSGPDVITLVKMGANHVSLLRQWEVWRLITYAFLHGSIAHLLCNMYSLYVIGTQIEAKYGNWRFCTIYFVSAIAGGLLSAGFTNYISVGASGAIFGLLGAMVYFGVRFRLYLRDSLKNKIIPVIILNLLLGFMVSGIDNACHIGGLIAGYLTAMAVGIPEDNKTKDSVNGTILLIIYLAFLIYIAFFH